MLTGLRVGLFPSIVHITSNNVWHFFQLKQVCSGGNNWSETSYTRVHVAVEGVYDSTCVCESRGPSSHMTDSPSSSSSCIRPRDAYLETICFPPILPLGIQCCVTRLRPPPRALMPRGSSSYGFTSVRSELDFTLKQTGDTQLLFFSCVITISQDIFNICIMSVVYDVTRKGLIYS